MSAVNWDPVANARVSGGKVWECEHEGRRWRFELTYLEPFLLNAKGQSVQNAWGGVPEPVRKLVIAEMRRRYGPNWG